MRRARNNPVKRWANEDVILFLEKMKLDGDKIERPSSQIYFNKLMEREKSLRQYGWKGMRDKLRNLKVKYKKAIDWRNNIGPGLGMEGPEDIQRICPEFQLMDEIFGGQANVSISYMCESEVDVKKEVEEEESAMIHESEFVDSFDLAYEPIRSTPSPRPSYDSSNGEPKMKKLKQKNSLFDILAEVQKERTQHLIEKLDLEKRKHEDEMALKRDMLELEKNKMEQECRLKETELANKLELQKLEMEKKMELLKYELELKYKQKE